VRLGKRFELTVDGVVDDALLEQVREIAEDLLANTVIEDVVAVHTVDAALAEQLSDGVAGETR